MAYNKEYYDGKKKKIEDKFGSLKDKTLNAMMSLINDFRTSQVELSQDMAEVNKEEAESIKLTEGKQMEETTPEVPEAQEVQPPVEPTEAPTETPQE